ncbi:Asp-tRNA(Asn)/Glu-tRNA(Gln) amidotransferase subunit GatB [Candidatus Saccharibacteria bacterium]|nr:Asp-tRNA(Asn)/Glu-tRNA(Gln) amidotransferase subunit GatB [Candidatus Saccharibacteria bacterium]
MNSVLQPYLIKGYLPTIGIECHVQLKTKTKLFAGVSNDARGAQPNTLISHICLGMPGALPVLNKSAVDLAMRAGFALNTIPQSFSKFDRKHYFYPDLPKGYQITQFDQPIILGGHVDIEVGGRKHSIGITRAHLEEDAGKNSHPEGKDYSLVDLNRAGTPLLEIVSEPEIHSATEAKAYVKELHLAMRYADVSDADLYQGNMRFDVNVSVSKDDTLGTRTETKNLNSFKSVYKAVEYEINRQIEILEKGDVVIQETRGWNDAKQKTYSQRSKEEAYDYRYFPEPDLPPVVLTKEQIESVKQGMNFTPNQLRQRLKKLNLSGSTSETIVDNLVPGRFMYQIMDMANLEQAKKIANWLASDVQAMVVAGTITWEDIRLAEQSFITLCTLVESNQISSTSAKVIIEDLVKNGGDPLKIAKDRDLLQVSDEDELVKLVKVVLDMNAKAVQDLKSGQDKVMGFLVGQVMKESRGKANPGLAKKLISKELEL